MFDYINQVEIPITHDMLLEALKCIRDDASHRDPQYGICHAVKYRLIDKDNLEYGYSVRDEDVLYKVITNWPKHSGNKEFPIHAGGKNPMHEYVNSTNKWSKKTKYGRLRWELLHWLINELEKNQ